MPRIACVPTSAAHEAACARAGTFALCRRAEDGRLYVETEVTIVVAPVSQ